MKLGEPCTAMHYPWMGRVSLDREVVQAWAREARAMGQTVRTYRRIVSAGGVSRILFVAIVTGRKGE